MTYRYGMKYRGFSPGCQPKGVAAREDDPSGRYYDILVYNRPLTAAEVNDYELEEIKEIEMKYDAFRISAIFADGTSVDDDLICDTDERAVGSGLATASAWYAEQNPDYYLISYYLDGKCVGNEKVDAAPALTYRVVDKDGYTLLETDAVPDVVEAVHGNEDAYSVLKLGADGEYHIDETDW